MVWKYLFSGCRICPERRNLNTLDTTTGKPRNGLQSKAGSKQKISPKIDIVKYTIVLDKNKKGEEHTYCFAVDGKSGKHQIGQILENLFNVKIAEMHSINFPPKTRK